MKILIVIPLQEEIDPFLKACAERGVQAEDSVIGKLPVVLFPDLGITLARGGLGKVQFAIQSQHLLDAFPSWDLVICAGAAGALVDWLSVGDVTIATETVEHGINNKFGEPLLPRFGCAETAIDSLRRVLLPPDSFEVHFGPITSGDEDVVDAERKDSLHKLTGALAVAWEGAGGARACRFSDVPFIEIRGVTDSANESAALDYKANLETVMKNVATLIVTWVRQL